MQPIIHLFDRPTSMTPAERIAQKARSNRMAAVGRAQYSAQREHARDAALLREAREVLQLVERSQAEQPSPPAAEDPTKALRSLRARVDAGMAIPASAFE